ncbi:hypothetical protein [Thioclava sp. F36-7]|uniref:hypothetical protein n=1 Tax=Thioclava sp. F36-7 TaxID=1915317 RepID=UPI001180551B|nr:hypothetical protein [Thioclava sp. F36-7]
MLNTMHPKNRSSFRASNAALSSSSRASTVFTESQAHPGTHRLLKILRSSKTRSVVSHFSVFPTDGGYRIYVNKKNILPIFVLHSWDQELGQFLGLTNFGNDILRYSWSGLQYHWRSDLAKTQEEGKPFLGRFQISSGTYCVNIDHITVPVFEKGKVSTIHGWFVCDKPLGESGPPNFQWSEETVVRRLQRSQPITLPARLSNRLLLTSLIHSLFASNIPLLGAIRGIFHKGIEHDKN